MFIIKRCEVCGQEFAARSWANVCCNDCKLDMYRSMKRKEERQITHINQGIIEAVKEATALDMSYGEYMAYPLRRRRGK